MTDLVGKLQDYVAEEFGHELERWQVTAVVLLCVFIFVGGVFFYVKDHWASERQVRPIKEQPGKKTREETVLVYVCGGVQNGGVYRMKAGSRVVDALSLAGGATADADLARLNLAKPVADGEKIYVPRAGEVSSAIDGADSASEKINLNTAGVEELDRLPGVGEAIAQRIITFRERHGKFESIEQLEEVEGIGPKKFSDLKDLVTI